MTIFANLCIQLILRKSKNQNPALVPHEDIRQEVDNSVSMDMKEQNHVPCEKYRYLPTCIYS